MAIAVITEDFVTKGGLIVQGTGTVTTSSVVSGFQTGTVQIAGGVGISKNLIVGTNASVFGRLTVSGDTAINGSVSIGGGLRLSITTASGVLSLTDITTATTGGAGAIKISGGAFVGNNIVIAGISASTGSVTNNALYVAGGVGIGNSLIVSGTALFRGDVIFNGAATNVYSTNTVYTDNLIELHVPNTPTWTLDDGQDIGLRFHYYSNGSNQNGALVLANNTKYLEWYDTGAESTTGTFTATTFGTFKTGNIILVGGTTATSTQSGTLQVEGGVGIGQDLYVGGDIFSNNFSGKLSDILSRIGTTATTISSGTAGAILYQSDVGVTAFANIGDPGQVLLSDGSIPYWGPITSASLDFANTATNIYGGTTSAIPFQTGPGRTTFSTTLKYNISTNVFSTVNAIFTGTANAISTLSGALQVAGGVGIGKNLYVGGDTILSGDLSIRGSDLYTNQTTFNLLDNTATTINFAGSATTINVGDPSGYVNIRSQLVIQNTSSAVSTLTGALQVAGGAGIQGDVYIGGTTYVGNNLIPTSSGLSLGSFTHPFADVYLGPNSLYVDSIVLSSNGTTFFVTSTQGLVLLNVNAGIFTTSSNSVSTVTGAVVVTGGVGIGQNLYVGGNEVLSGNFAINGGNITTNQATFNLLNNTATTVNFAGAGTAITIGALTGYTRIRSGTSASSTITGALQVVGGAGVGLDLYVGGNEVLSGNLAVNGGSITVNQSTFNLLNSTATTVNFAGSATIINIGSSSGYTAINNRTTVTNNTVSTSTTTGALQVRGGVGIGGDVYVGGMAYVNNSPVLTTATIGSFGVSAISAGTDTVVSSSTGIVTVWNVSTLQTITNRGAATTNIITLTSNSPATSTSTGALRIIGGVGIGGRLYVGDRTLVTSTSTAISSSTGALVVSGGVGIGQNLYVGGSIYGTLYGTLIGLSSTSTNIANGGPGQLVYQTDNGITSFVATGTSGQILISDGTNSPIFVNTATFIIGYSANIAGGSAGSLVYQSSANTTNFVSTGSVLVGFAVTATNLLGGAGGSIPYQSAAGLTGMLPIGSSGYVLTSDGTDPSWGAIGSLSAGTATNISITNDVINSTVNYIGYVNTSSGNSNIRVAGPSGLTYQPSSGNLGLGITTATAKLDIVGGVKISGITTITNSTLASSTVTGALQVAGGIGIGGNIFVGGSGIVTDQTTFDLINTNATAINIAGAGISISIGGANTGTTTIKNNLTVAGNLTVQGNTTIVDSTVTNITDPIIMLGGLSNNQPLLVSDGKDKGIAFKWHNGTVAKTGFFGYKNATGVFTIIPDATISSEVVTGTKGIIDANINGGTAQSFVYQSSPNTTAFLAAGTAGYVLSTNGTSSAPTWIKAADNNTSTNITGGTVGQIPFQTGTSLTSFFGPGTAGNILVSNGATTSGPTFQNTLTLAGTATSTSTISGALQVRGGIGVAGNIYVGNRIGWTSATNISAVYQYYNTATNSLDTVFG